MTTEKLTATYSQVWAVRGGIDQVVPRPGSINMESTGQSDDSESRGQVLEGQLGEEGTSVGDNWLATQVQLMIAMWQHGPKTFNSLEETRIRNSFFFL